MYAHVRSRHHAAHSKANQLVCTGFLQQLQLWQEMGYVFKPDHPGYNLVTMRQLAMRYDAGEELASITTNLAVPSESTNQVDVWSMFSHKCMTAATILMAVQGAAHGCMDTSASDRNHTIDRRVATC